jgi:type VI secretion system protein ImpI/type VI secretion system protein
MTLTISILRCPDSVPPQTRKVTGGELSIGRGPENDWVLPDPDRVLSKRHCVVAFRHGGWQVADVSSNGTYINRESDPLGPGRVQELRDGDRLRLGSYEMELRIEEAPQSAFTGASGYDAAPSGFGAPRGAAAAHAADPFGDDPFGAPRGNNGANPFDDDPLLRGPAPASFSQGVALPMDFDPLAPDPSNSAFNGPTQSDHTPVVADAFHPPNVSRLPDDWDLEFSSPAPGPVANPPTRPGPAPPDFLAPEPPPPIQPPIAAPVPVPLPAPIPMPPPMPSPGPPPVAPPVAAPPPPAGVAPGGDLMAAFLRGADLADAHPPDPAVAMERLGAAFRAVVAGIRQTLIARATVKSEFRIEQTMIRARGNNPLKFSAGDDDAMATMLGIGRGTGMAPAEAVTEALRDIRLHELATMSAMQSGVRALLQRMDPARLREEGEKGGGLIPAQRRARAFELYEKLHGDISQALADDFDSVFGKAFARAYEQALREASDREHP